MTVHGYRSREYILSLYHLSNFAFSTLPIIGMVSAPKETHISMLQIQKARNRVAQSVGCQTLDFSSGHDLNFYN